MSERGGVIGEHGRGSWSPVTVPPRGCRTFPTGVAGCGVRCRAGCGVRCRAGSVARRGAGSSARRRTADLGSIVAALRRGVAVGDGDPIGVCWLLMVSLVQR